MIKLKDHVEFESGSPQTRIKKHASPDAQIYLVYNQTDLKNDLYGVLTEKANNKTLRTEDDVSLLREGDLIFSLISGTAAIVGPEHAEYLFTQNYVRLTCSPALDAGFLAYMLNHHPHIARQFFASMQGSTFLKFTVTQLRDLRLYSLPPIEKQRAIGRIYFSQLKVNALRSRVQEEKTKLLLHQLKEVIP